MKNILVKLLLLFLLIGVTNITIRHFFYQKNEPFYWGNEVAHKKRNFLVGHSKNYNSIFIGSSKTHHQINVQLFDQLNQNKLKSFNFGVDGMLPPESFELYKNLISVDSIPIQYAFVELDWLGTVNYENLHNWRSFYWLDLENLGFILKASLSSIVPLQYQAWTLFTISVNYTEKLFNFGYISEYLKHVIAKEQVLDASEFQANGGFQPLLRTKAFSNNDLNKITQVKSASINSYHKKQNNKYITANEIYLSKLEELIESSKRRGIHLIFIVPPQWKTYQYDILLPISIKIDKAHIIDMADANMYPEFFNVKYLFDSDHLNEEGAKLYTKKIADKFRNIKELQSLGYHP